MWVFRFWYATANNIFKMFIEEWQTPGGAEKLVRYSPSVLFSPDAHQNRNNIHSSLRLYDVLSDEEIETIKELAKPLVTINLKEKVWQWPRVARNLQSNQT
jgi:hypothetical protein